jgi:ABC-type glycerol-3-phosphate transport system substrate-binding protein
MTKARWLAATEASAQKADVIHFYTNSGESLAIGVFAKEYNKRDGTWQDDPAVGPQAESALAMNRIAGGNPPAAMQWPVGAPTRELYEQGMLTTLDDLAAAGNWAKNLPPIILRNVVFDGHFVTAPVDIHGANWMFYSTKVFKAVDLEPPKSWDEFFAMAPKLQAAGYIPLAYGANAQQEGGCSWHCWQGSPVAKLIRRSQCSMIRKRRAARASARCSKRWASYVSTSMPAARTANGTTRWHWWRPTRLR